MGGSRDPSPASWSLSQALPDWKCLEGASPWSLPRGLEKWAHAGPLSGLPLYPSLVSLVQSFTVFLFCFWRGRRGRWNPSPASSFSTQGLPPEGAGRGPFVSLPQGVCACARRPPVAPTALQSCTVCKSSFGDSCSASSGVTAGARAVLRRARVCVLGRLGRDLNIYELCSTRTRRVYLALCSSPLPRHTLTLTLTRTRTPACKLARLGARRRVASAPAPPRELPR